MRLLFFKEDLPWPRSSGHDVHGFHLMAALAARGHAVSFASLRAHDPRALAGADLHSIHRLSAGVEQDGPLRLSRLQARFQRYWGIEPWAIRSLAELAGDLRADAVIVVGLNVLPYLTAIERAVRIWYAADEWMKHHLSLVRWRQPSSWRECKQAAIKGLYERTFASCLDRVWMVSEAERRAMLHVSGVGAVDVIRNGVDGSHFRPGDEPQHPHSCIFWGRLDYEPNLQALRWFHRAVWPRVRARVPDARFTVLGFCPTAAARSLASADEGIRLVADLPDIRSEILRHQVVVLPFVSGGGIKNKLLEAAALGMPVLCTPRTDQGLSAGEALARASSPAEWLSSLTELWRNAARRRELGAAARAWVLREHTWDAAARQAAAGIEESLRSGHTR